MEKSVKEKLDAGKIRHELRGAEVLLVVAPKKVLAENLGELSKLVGGKQRVSMVRLVGGKQRGSMVLLNRANLDEMSFARYCHNVICQIRVAGLKGLILCAEEDLDKKLKEDFKMFADGVMEVN